MSNILLAAVVQKSLYSINVAAKFRDLKSKGYYYILYIRGRGGGLTHTLK